MIVYIIFERSEENGQRKDTMLDIFKDEHRTAVKIKEYIQKTKENKQDLRYYAIKKEVI